MNIRCVYMEEPPFPATDQHPDAARYRVGDFWVDAIGGEPSLEEVEKVVSPPLFDLKRPAFLFMMGKIGVTEQQVELLIDKMPAGDARDLALLVFRYQQTFSRDNDLLNSLTDAAGISKEIVDAAWHAAENLSW